MLWHNRRVKLGSIIEGIRLIELILEGTCQSRAMFASVNKATQVDPCKPDPPEAFAISVLTRNVSKTTLPSTIRLPSASIFETSVLRSAMVDPREDDREQPCNFLGPEIQSEHAVSSSTGENQGVLTKRTSLQC